MYSPLQMNRARGDGGEPLPTAYRALEEKEFRFLKGQTSLVVAGPGTGKSAFALNVADKTGVPSLVFSADSDAFTQLTRLISLRTGKSIKQSANLVLNNHLQGVAEELNGSPTRFVFESSPTTDDIANTMDAYWEQWGDFPDLVIVDNVTNVRVGGADEDDPFSGLETLMDILHGMGRATTSHVMALHHSTGKYNNADQPIPLDGIKGQIGRTPEQVLTLFRASRIEGQEQIGISAVKNRGGKADPSGEDYALLNFDPSRMRINDPPNPF